MNGRRRLPSVGRHTGAAGSTGARQRLGPIRCWSRAGFPLELFSTTFDWGSQIVSPQLIGPLLVIQPIQFPPIQYVSPARLGALLGFRLDVIAPLTIGFLLEQVANALR